MSTTTITTFEDVLAAAKRENWPFVDENIGCCTDLKYVIWALNDGLRDRDNNVRDFAATILDESPAHISDPVILKRLEAQMLLEPYRIVCFRLAVALWKRGYRTVAVEANMQGALKDPYVREAAEKWSQ